jgi:uncharacterized protein involved in exopolysaccharide biosynthesis
MANPSPPFEPAPLDPSDSPSPGLKTWPVLRIVKYLIVAGLINGALWGFALSYLKKTKPVYVSQLTLNVAGSGQGVNVNVPDIGQATTSTTSAFSSTADPRENYKLMLSSSTVLEAAAQSLDLDLERFGQPKIKIVNNTTMMEITISGQDPAMTQKKAEALYGALSARLNILRTGEQRQRNDAIQKAVTTAQSKLTTAQSRLSGYKSASGLNSNAQVTNLIDTIELLRKQRAELIAQTQQAGDRQQQLSRNLQLSPQLAADALLLQTDQQFQKSLKDYSQTAIDLKALLENRGENYPDVIALKTKQDSLRTMLLQRGQALLNKPLTQMTLERLNLDNSNGSGLKRSELFQQLILANAEYQGLIGQQQALTGQIKNLEQRLSNLTQKQSVLDRYLRDVQIAEAIFTSTLAKVDLSKSDPYGSFPLLQLVEEPNLPSIPSAPQPKLVMIGASLGSFLVTVGLTLVWWRNPILKFGKRALREILA